ncbi:MAG: molybdopterin molybdotransferase MoeA [Bacteroidia bacterium]|nr:molybdopterin molybdotransferase MoeA [Bacteroidia bacterium]
MISVQDATAIILSHLFKSKTKEVELSEAVGRILGEPVVADRDFPPFNRVSMDGIAINSKALEAGQKEFILVGTQAAGMPPIKLKNRNDAIEVMTGAVLPDGADTVIRYEDVVITDNKAKITVFELTAGQNIHRQAQDAKQNQVLLSPGLKISPAEVALFATVGKSKVQVFNFPKTAIVSTGDELVDIDKIPLAHQIRRSNDAALQAALMGLGCHAYKFHLTDSKEQLMNKLTKILQDHELIILSGGVSKGKFDFVPEVLETLGIKKLFHQVSQKPGKPFWFGKSDQHTVFALPGNPVSTYMCFYRYIKPWLTKSMGLEQVNSQAILASDYAFKPGLTYFLQVKTINEAGKLIAYPIEGGGSGDFANLKDINGFLELPLEKSEFKAGEIFPYHPFR